MKARHSQKEIISTSLQEEKVHFVPWWWKRNCMGWKNSSLWRLPIFNSLRGDRVPPVVSVLTPLAPKVRGASTLSLLHAACSVATRWHLWARTSSALVGRQKVFCCEPRGRLELWPASWGLVNTAFSKYLLGSLASNEGNKRDTVSCPPSAGHSNISLILLVEHVSLYFTSRFLLFTLGYSFSLLPYWK